MQLIKEKTNITSNIDKDINKEDKNIKNEKVVVTKKPIMSMINKKKCNYSLKQKIEDIQPKNNDDISGT